MTDATTDHKAYRIAIAALMVLALVLFAYPLIRAFYHFEIDMNEGWNAYYQMRAAAGLPLYTGLPQGMFNNYPPLSFYLIGWLGQMIGDVILAGRLVSLAALGVIALACGRVIRVAGGGTWDARLGMTCCLLFFTAFATDYVGMNDPQLLGQALAIWGMVIWLQACGRMGWAIGAAALLVASVMTKHNLVLLPLLVAGDVILRGSMRQKVVFFGAAITLTLLCFGLIWFNNGDAFFAQTLAARDWDVERAFLFTMEIFSRFQAPIMVVGLGLIAARRDDMARLILAYLAAAIALGAGFSGGAGTDINVFFDLSIALAIGAGLVAIELRRRGADGRGMAALVLAINAGVVLFAPQALGRFAVDALGDMRARELAFAADVAYLQSVSGDALCQSPLLCLRSGKPLVYDSFNATQAMYHGALAPDDLAVKLRAHRFAVVQISDRRQHMSDDPAVGQVMPARFINFDDRVFDVLDSSYRLDHTGLNGRFYRPKS
jgi:hypothetical protein